MEKIDATIGKSIRHYRWLQGISQADLAAALGISEAQMRSHEAGKSRVSAARLMAISGHLGVEVSAFFQRNVDALRPASRPEPVALRGVGDAIQSGKYLAALMTHFQRLNDVQKQAVLHLVVSISKEDLSAAVPVPPQQKPELCPAVAGDRPEVGGQADRGQADRGQTYRGQAGRGEARDGPY